MSINQIKTKNGKVWRARLVLKSGKRISKCFDRKVDAEQWIENQISENNNPDFKPCEPIRFEDLASEFLKYSKSDLQPATYIKYDGVIRNYHVPEFGRTYVNQISKKQFLDYRIKVSELPLSQASKFFIFSTLKTIFKKGIELDLLNHNPTLGVKSLKKGQARTEYWSLSEIQEFLNRMIGHPRHALYILALNTGMRSGEIFGLCWDCVDLDNEIITVKRTLDQKNHVLKETTKTGIFRSIGINKALRDLFVKLKRDSKSKFVLDRVAMGCGDTSHLAREFHADCVSVGMRPIKFHDLRHTFATQLVRKSGDIHAVANVMGHKSITMSERYAHFGIDHAVQVAKMVSFESEEEPQKVVPMRKRNA